MTVDVPKGQAGCPSGFIGKLVGHIMNWYNRQDNDWTISLLDLQPADHVLEIGFGPGQARPSSAPPSTSPMASLRVSTCRRPWLNRQSVATPRTYARAAWNCAKGTSPPYRMKMHRSTKSSWSTVSTFGRNRCAPYARCTAYSSRKGCWLSPCESSNTLPIRFIRATS